MATSSGLFLATIYNQSRLAERKHVARYWSINTAATAFPLSAHFSPLVITTKLAAAILGGPLFGGGVLPAQYYPCGYNKHAFRCCLNLENEVVSKYKPCRSVLEDQ